MWCRLRQHMLEEAVLSQELRLMQLLGADANSSKILLWEVDCAFFKEWSSMHKNEDEEWDKGVLSTACVTVQQQPSSNPRGVSNFFILKGFFLVRDSDRGFFQQLSTNHCSSHLMFFPIALQWLQWCWSSLVMPSCLLGAKILAQPHNPFLFSTTDLTLCENLSSSSKLFHLSPSFSFKNVLSDWRLTKNEMVTFQSSGMLPPAAKPTQWPYYIFMLFANAPTLKIYGIANILQSACHIKLLILKWKHKDRDTELIISEKSTARDWFK